MDYDPGIFNDILIILTLIVVNGLFVAAEYALVRSNPTHFRSRKKVGSATALKLIDELDLSLSGIQFGITLASIILGWFGVQACYSVFAGILSGTGDWAASAYANAVLVTLSLSVIVYLHVVLGEMFAKSVALRHPETTLLILSPLIFLVALIGRPLLFLFSRSASLLLRMFGISRSAELHRVHSLSELSFLVSDGSGKGAPLDEEEKQMLRGVFGLSDTVAREIMTPRTDLIALSAEATLGEVLGIIRESGFSRFPVTGEGIDDVLGVLLARDILQFAVPDHKVLNADVKEFNVRKLMREAYFIPGTKPIDDLLSEFKRRKLHLAIVLDEHGGVDGVVSLEDLIEEIVGDIFDESDVPEKRIVVQENGDVLIDGGQLVADLNSKFSLEIPEGDYDTIAGFIFTSLGRMPRPGDSILIDRAEADGNGASTEAASGAAERADKSGASGAEKEDEAQKAMITVEKVQSYRIETVRLRPQLTRQNSEPLPGQQPSNLMDSTSERRIRALN